MSKFTLYYLADPDETDLPVYVGRTKMRTNVRLGRHIQEAREGSHYPVHQWIAGLLAEGRRPVLVEVCSTDDPRDEKRLIAELEDSGIELLNVTHLTDEQKAAVSRAQKGRPRTDEQREVHRRANLGRKHTDETRAKVSEANRRRWAKQRGETGD